MLIAKGKIRTNVIPDIQVKILALCLNENENGIIPRINNETNLLDYRADQVFQETIKNKIEKQKNIITLELKKSLVNKLSDFEVLPITMRKHLLCKESRAS